MRVFNNRIIDPDRIYNNIKTLSEKNNVLLGDIEYYAGVSQGFISRLKCKNGNSDFIKYLMVLNVASSFFNINIESLIFDDYNKELDEKQKQLFEQLENVFHDVEWYHSGDIGREILIERLEQYRKGGVE